MTPTFIEFLSRLDPCLGSDYKKEFTAIREILEAFNCDSPSALKKSVLAFKKKYDKSPEGFASRVQEVLDKRNANEDVSALIPVLVTDFTKLTVTSIKEIGKRFKINLARKEDVSYFENWLSTGQEPPTLAEQLSGLILPAITEALQIRDSENELTEDDIEKIVVLAQAINKEYKVDGLKVFMSGLHIAPIGKTGAALIKEIRNYLKTLALNCVKATRMYDL